MLTPAQVAEAAALRLDMARMRQLQARAAGGLPLSAVERLALADLRAAAGGARC